MKSAVCMKQVPAESSGLMDEKTGVIVRAGLKSEVNSYDLSALEAALRIRETVPAEIHVFTMGPPKAEEVIRVAFSMGADKGFLISDPAFSGADVLATSYTLYQAINTAGKYEMILCGRQTTDGDTAQVSGALAQWMNLPHANWVSGIEAVSETSVIVEQKTEREQVRLKLPLPCLLSVEREEFLPRMPSLRLKMAAGKKPFVSFERKNFTDQNPEHYGLRGSATRVKKIYPPPRMQPQPLFRGSAEECVELVFRELGKG
jgi:electron transfer flavoprotein beta subunit